MAKNSVASTPVKAGEAPVNTIPHLSVKDAQDAAMRSVSAVMKGGAVTVTFIASALLVGYLQGVAMKTKMDVIKDEFSLALKKKGLGGTQTKKYMSAAGKIAVQMFKECSYGMEMAALIAADTPDKAHNAVTGWIARHTKGKKTEHGFKLDDALDRLNVLLVYLGQEPDPNKPETLETATSEADRANKRRETAAKAIEKDGGILSKVNAETLVDTVAKVVTFDKLVTAHVNKMTDAAEVMAELKAIQAAYTARIKALKTDMGTKAKPKADAPAPEVSQEAAVA